MTATTAAAGSARAWTAAAGTASATPQLALIRTETDRHVWDHPHCPGRHRGPDCPRRCRARAVLALDSAGHRHRGLDQVPAAALPPVAPAPGPERLIPGRVVVRLAVSSASRRTCRARSCRPA